MKRKNKLFLPSLPCLLLAILFLAVLPVASQAAEPLALRLNKDFGYAMGGEIQGTFSLRATGPDDLARVVFNIDEQVLGEDLEAPFRVQFHTDNYPLGSHTFSAAGFTAAGQELASNQIRVTTVSAAEGTSAGFRIIVPIFAIILGAFVLSIVVSMLTSGKLRNLPPGAPRSYGISGGAICPNCGRPFGMHIFGLNLVVGKLDRCPFCGKWALQRRASPAELRQAEQAEIAQAEGSQAATFVSEEERLRKELEDSRFHDT